MVSFVPAGICVWGTIPHWTVPPIKQSQPWAGAQEHMVAGVSTHRQPPGGAKDTSRGARKDQFPETALKTQTCREWKNRDRERERAKELR